MKKSDICVEILKEWGGFRVGDIVRFGVTKGERFIESGGGRKVKKQQAVNDPKPEPVVKKPPQVETATAPPVGEQAIATPEPKKKTKPDEKK
jgi:hypothetical protein